MKPVDTAAKRLIKRPRHVPLVAIVDAANHDHATTEELAEGFTRARELAEGERVHLAHASPNKRTNRETNDVELLKHIKARRQPQNAIPLTVDKIATRSNGITRTLPAQVLMPTGFADAGKCRTATKADERPAREYYKLAKGAGHQAGKDTGRTVKRPAIKAGDIIPPDHRPSKRPTWALHPEHTTTEGETLRKWLAHRAEIERSAAALLRKTKRTPSPEILERNRMIEEQCDILRGGLDDCSDNTFPPRPRNESEFYRRLVKLLAAIKPPPRTSWPKSQNGLKAVADAAGVGYRSMRRCRRVLSPTR